jgi:hypothetical protein
LSATGESRLHTAHYLRRLGQRPPEHSMEERALDAATHDLLYRVFL